MTRSSRLVSHRSKPSRYLYRVVYIVDTIMARSSGYNAQLVHLCDLLLLRSKIWRSSHSRSSSKRSTDCFPLDRMTTRDDGLARYPAKWILVLCVYILFFSLPFSLVLGRVSLSDGPSTSGRVCNVVRRACGSHICLQLKRVARFTPSFIAVILACSQQITIEQANGMKIVWLWNENSINNLGNLSSETWIDSRIFRGSFSDFPL